MRSRGCFGRRRRLIQLDPSRVGRTRSARRSVPGRVEARGISCGVVGRLLLHHRLRSLRHRPRSASPSGQKTSSEPEVQASVLFHAPIATTVRSSMRYRSAFPATSAPSPPAAAHVRKGITSTYPAAFDHVPAPQRTHRKTARARQEGGAGMKVGSGGLNALTVVSRSRSKLPWRPTNLRGD
jgi:hypothetical protein